MYRKNILNWLIVILFMSALLIALTQVGIIPLKHILVGITAGILYGVIVIVYLLRFAFIFLGVFGIYRLLRERHEKQLVA